MRKETDQKGGMTEENTPNTTSTSENQSPSKPKRLRSLDALRGFDMFWIVGGSGLAGALAKYTEWGWVEWLSGQMHHPGWSGFTFYDLIFPLFLFLAGVAMPFSLGRKVEQGASKWKLVRKVAIRACALVFLGAIHNGLLNFRPLAETRICSVLGYIGMAYFFAALIYLFSNTRHQIIWSVGILFGYWAALMWINVPGHGAGVLTPEGCITAYVDRALLPWRFNVARQLYDSQGLLVTLPAIVTALLGGLTGQFIRSSKLNPFAIGGILIAAGVVFYGLGKLWGTQLFISKELWNPTFVLHCAGWSLILLGLFYLIIDALGFWRWSFFFIVIGMNSITIYLGVQMVHFGHTSGFLFGGLVGKAEEPLRAVLGSVAYITTWWIVLLFMYRKKIFLRV